jgi:hypothetical protein
MPFRLILPAIVIVSMSLSPSGLLDAQSIAEADFARLQALIKPKPNEQKWEQIPWLTNLWEARQRAAAEGRPILLWEMDGHPLGCT